jgi:hypothetical protein
MIFITALLTLVLALFSEIFVISFSLYMIFVDNRDLKSPNDTSADSRFLN